MQIFRHITTTETPGGQATLGSISVSDPVWNHSASEMALVIPFGDLAGIDSSEITEATETEVNQKSTLSFLSAIYSRLDTSPALSLGVTRSNVGAGNTPLTLRQTFTAGSTQYLDNLNGFSRFMPLPSDNTGNFKISDAFPNCEIIGSSDNPSAEGVWIPTFLSAPGDDSRQELWRLFNYIYANVKIRSADISSAIVGIPSTTPSGITPAEDNVWEISGLNESDSRRYSFFRVSKSINFEYIIKNDGTWDINISTSS